MGTATVAYIALLTSRLPWFLGGAAPAAAGAGYSTRSQPSVSWETGAATAGYIYIHKIYSPCAVGSREDMLIFRLVETCSADGITRAVVLKLCSEVYTIYSSQRTHILYAINVEASCFSCRLKKRRVQLLLAVVQLR